MTASLVDIHEWNNTLDAELKAAGLKARPYHRPPNARDLFVIALDSSNVIRFWCGSADITFVSDKKARQSVLDVYEKGRTVTNTVKIDFHVWQNNLTLEHVRNSLSRYWIERHLGVQLPVGAEYSITAYDRIEKPERNEYGLVAAAGYGTVTLQGKTKATRQSFLIGRDEKSQFISALPRRCKSVFDAHEALRPPGVPRTALRQGEWFFVPATAAEKAAIAKSVAGRGSKGICGARDYGSATIHRSRVGELEDGSSHHAPCNIIVSNRLYAVGLVYDTRPNRHGQLLLRDWHRVIRNREVVSSTIADRGTARWD